MGLIDEMMCKCTMIDKRTTSDGEGGFTTIWNDGATFEAAISFDSSMQARIAEKQGVTSYYTVTTRKNLVLNYHDIFRRESDKKVFRVTSDGDDKFSPQVSSLDMRQVTAEEFILS